MAVNTISILDGSTFLVSDLRGDIDASPDQAHGLVRDTRFLSFWRLTANGAPLNVLSTDATHYFASTHFLVPPTGTVNDSPTVLLGLEPDLPGRWGPPTRNHE
jgi:hypothetical protein